MLIRTFLQKGYIFLKVVALMTSSVRFSPKKKALSKHEQSLQKNYKMLKSL